MFKTISFIIALICFVNCGTNRNIEKNIINRLFDANRYDHRVLPEVSGNKWYYSPEELVDKEISTHFQTEETSIETIVDSRIQSNTSAIIDTIDIYLRLIENIDIIKQTLETQLTFRQRWKDTNLVYSDGTVINLSPEINVWKPDLFISNEIESRFHDMLEPNSIIRIYPNGSILYSVRITVKTTCPMDFKYFPFDQQTCSIMIASYGHTTDDIVFRWKVEDPIQVSKRFKRVYVNNMKLIKARTGHCTSKTNTGEYSCLKVDFTFERNSKLYICRWFLSSSLCVLIVWLSFWLSAKHSKSRLSLLIGSTIMMAIITIDISKSKPDLYYCTTVDIWSMICWLFIIVGYIHLGLFQYLSQKEDKDSNSSPKQEDAKEKLIPENKLELFRQKWNKKSRMSKLDFASIVGFPVVFIMIQLIILLSHRLV